MKVINAPRNTHKQSIQRHNSQAQPKQIVSNKYKIFSLFVYHTVRPCMYGITRGLLYLTAIELSKGNP